ncbi:mandelate racemase/muconate lactonizing enzyme family protein [Natronosporangium hydrolyticum]|uniref:Mandelate racemase/muconate lactonizing enzyme family protein n=1 Tax=Natronosporangium hydrolyticum TaxID=2811111 RepID=A0A895Y4V9_9ACTN|nr:mandelate racemase/muconate lactonizing enzyme family protein [Natronosporangium hydrolyticum]QSB12727.1 mandelate racemase/muconate lactonizing enzyme family protein [Natronosporangium hydrolyticum]
MRIVEMKTVVVGTPWRELTFVELITDDGQRGLGEARMVNKTETLGACLAELAERYIIGTDPFDVERLAWRAHWEDYGRAGEITQSALACLDMACHDLMGKSLGVPVWKLLGGQFRDRVPAYANGWYQGERTPESFAAMASKVVGRGYRGLKVDPFGAATAELTRAELALATDIIAAVRDSVGPDVALMVEMHGRFTAATAVAAATAMAPYRPEWIEEPVPPYHNSALRQVRAGTSLPIATGERVHTVPEFREVFEAGTVDIVQADLTHIGGFTGLRKLANYADSYGLLMAPHNVAGPVATAANVHFAIACPNYKVLEHFNDFADPWVNDLVDQPCRVAEADGCFGLPTAPGLGVSLDYEAAAARPRTRVHFNLMRDGWQLRDELTT